jgi:hypothetical protein
MRLADYLIEGDRAQPFGERGAAGQVLQARFVEEVHAVSISFVPQNPSLLWRCKDVLRNVFRNDWETVVL